ncbi:MAG: T9SS type A sorting domain-containing protein [Bacteroidetes bacterium]|nr:T9SS type A sorting domain-containing protein [Bacteroidota bacterium]
MKWHDFIVVFVTGFAASVFAQEPLLPVPGKAVYFDVSPPLRNLLLQPSEKIDCSWKDGVVPNFISEVPANTPGSLNPDTVIQFQNGHVFPDTMLRNFDGLGNVNHASPPDTYGDAGPGHYVQLVNLSFAIYDKTGVKLAGPFNTSSIWEGMPNNSNWGDGIVMYDEVADRWLISQFSFPTFPLGPFYEMVAVSQTPDPLGAWYRWEFAFGDIPDYPKFGIWPDGYYMSCTRLKAQTLQRDGVTAVAFDRNAMISGDPAPATIQFSLSAAESPYTFLPADCDGPFPPTGTPNYFGYTTNGFFVLREFHADWANPSASTFGNPLNLPISPYANVVEGGIPQKGSDKLLSSLDGRLMCRLQYRRFKDYQAMVVNHTVGVASYAGIRWYELRKTNGSWFVNQQSTYAPDTLCRWMGSIAMDSAGNIALGYSVSARSVYPSVRFTGRMNHDPPGQMTIHETGIVGGGGCQTGSWSGQNRWGDYSSMVSDPVEPSTFWYTQEYYATTSNDGWSTRIASFSFASILDIQATATPPEICPGGTAMLDVDVPGGSGSCTYSWTSDPPGFTSDQKSPLITAVNPATYIVRVVSGSQVKTDSVVVPVIPLPSAMAGNDTTICRYIAGLPLAGTATNCNAVRWFSSGDGYFTQPEALNTMYRPGPGDKVSDSLVLTLTAYPAALCLPASATRKIVIDQCAGLDDLPNTPFMVRLHPNPVHGRLSIDISGVNDQVLTVVISNSLDERLFSETIEPKEGAVSRQVDVSRYSKGIYYLRVETKSGIVARTFIVR